MRINFVTVGTNLEEQTPFCQCGTKMEYTDKLNKLYCPNPDCIKNRMQSVMNTLNALDKKAKESGFSTSLVDCAYQNYDLLTNYVESCEIYYGAELITLGNSFDDLGKLGVQLSNVVDTVQFELKDLSAICGSSLLFRFPLDFTKISTNQRQAIVDINKQLGIDGTIWLAQLLFDDYTIYKSMILNLADYLTLVRPAQLKRSTMPVELLYSDADELMSELQDLDKFASTTLNTTSNTFSNIDEAEVITPTTSMPSDESAKLLEDLLNW